MDNVQKVLQMLVDRVKKLEASARVPSADGVSGQWVSMQPWAATPAIAITSSTNFTHLVAMPRSLKFKKFTIATYTQTTNNASNYWAMTVTTTIRTILSGVDFHLDTINTWTTHSYSTGFTTTDLIAASDVYITCSFVKVGTPGGLFIGNPLFYYV